MRFCARFADVFGRKEPRAQAAKHLRGLLASLPRKNGWQVAEAIGDRSRDATQRLLYQAQWSADAARDRLLQYTIEVFADADGIGVVDETGFIKRGTRSAGVKRQYSGTAGKIENCQLELLAATRLRAAEAASLSLGELALGERIGWVTVKKYARLAEVTGVTPHTFRHSVATRLARDPQVDMVTAATFLGHSRWILRHAIRVPASTIWLASQNEYRRHEWWDDSP